MIFPGIKVRPVASFSPVLKRIVSGVCLFWITRDLPRLPLKAMTSALQWQPGPLTPPGPSPPVHRFAVMVPHWIIFHCGQPDFKKSSNAIAMTKQNIVLCVLFCLLSAAIPVKNQGYQISRKCWVCNSS